MGQSPQRAPSRRTPTIPGPRPPRTVRAPRGASLTCKNWLIEAAYRMVQNNLDPEVAENPDALVVYGGIGKAARNWDCFEAILKSLRELNEDESLLIQSGKPVGVFKTHPDAPRVLLANSNLVPKWATWGALQRLDQKGLMMYGQMTAGSWIYIGSQGIVQGTYETFVEAGASTSAAAWPANGFSPPAWAAWGAQPLAATFAGFACSLNIECQQSHRVPIKTRYLDEQATDLDDALARIAKYTAESARYRLVCSATRCGNPARAGAPRQSRRHQTGYRDRPDLGARSGQRLSADGLDAAAVAGRPHRQRPACRPARRRRGVLRGACAGDAGFPRDGHPHRRLRQQHPPGRLRPWRQECIRLPGLCTSLHPPLFCRGKGRSAGWRCRVTRRTSEDRRQDEGAVPGGQAPASLARHGRRTHRVPGPAGAHLLDRPGRAAPGGLAFNEMVRRGELKAPIVIGRDHLDSGSVASPNRETEAMMDGSDAVSDWPLLNALLNTAGGATWVSLHHGGGVGMGYSQHAGVVIVCDGTDAAAKRVERVLWNDPATGVMRHADAGYEIAKHCLPASGN